MFGPKKAETTQNMAREPKTVALVVAAERTAMTFYKGYVRFLHDRGWKVAVIAQSNGALESWAESEGGFAESITIARNPALIEDVRALFKTTQYLRQLKPDVVVSATPKAGLIGTIAGRLAGVRNRVYQIWGLRLETETGIKRKILSLLERLTIACSTQLLANSQSLAREIISLKLAPRQNIVVLGNGSSHGVDTNWFSPEAEEDRNDTLREFLESAADSLIVVFVGRITPDKGLDTLLQAQRECDERGFKFRILIVGAKEDEQLFNKIANLPKDKVLKVGRTEDVRPYIRNSHLLCLPSHREGFPNVVLEAAALGVPAVVSNATGAVDSVIDGVTGRIFPVGDATALADILSEIEDPVEWKQRFGRRARKRVLEDFDQDLVWKLQAENLDWQVESSQVDKSRRHR